MRGSIGFGIRLPNTNISHVRQTLVPFSTFSSSGSAGGHGRGRGRGRDSPLSSVGHTDLNGQALGEPDLDESKSDSLESPVPPGYGPSGLGHGRGKPLPPPSSGRPSFSSFMSSLKPPPAGRGQVGAPAIPQPANDSGRKKPMFFKKDDGSGPTVETRPNVSSIGDREVNHKLIGNITGMLSGLGRGKPMKQPGSENQVKEENRHIRPRPALDPTGSETLPKGQQVQGQEDAVKNARKILSKGGDGEGSTGRRRGGQGRVRGQEGREKFTRRGRRERDVLDQDTDDASATGIYVEDEDDSGERLAEKVGPEVMNQLVEGFEDVADRVLPSPLYDEFLGALDTNFAIEFEPEYLMGEFGRNPDIDEKPPIPLRDALEKVKPFLMAYEGIQSQEEWEAIMEEIMARVPLLKEIVDHYSGPDRVTAKKQQEELERVAKTLPQSAPSSVKQFTDRAVLSLQSNPGWGFDKKCQFMDKLVWEVSQHYK